MPILPPKPPPISTGDRHLEQAGRHVTHAEEALRGTPDRDVPVLVVVGTAVVRLDVALVRHRGRELAVHDHVGLFEADIGVAGLELEALGDVGRLGPDHGAGHERAGDLLRAEELVQHRRVLVHRLAHVQHRLEHLVLDLDQVERVLGDVRVRGRDGGDGVAAVEHLLAGEHVVEQPAGARRRALADVDLRVVGLREVGVGDDAAHALEGFRLRGVDALDACVGVRAAQHAAEQHPRGLVVAAVPRTTGDLVRPVVADWAGADDLVVAGLLSGDHVVLLPAL